MADIAGSYLAGAANSERVVEGAFDAYDRAKQWKERLRQADEAHMATVSASDTERRKEYEAVRHQATEESLKASEITMQEGREKAYSTAEAARARYYDYLAKGGVGGGKGGDKTLDQLNKDRANARARAASERTSNGSISPETQAELDASEQDVLDYEKKKGINKTTPAAAPPKAPPAESTGFSWSSLFGGGKKAKSSADLVQQYGLP